MKTSTLSQKLYAFGAGLLITSSVIAQTPDLGKLSPDGKTIKYVAIGSSLSAGVRDGGVYAEAQRTSFPALLAQQLGIQDFKQPLLEGNGTGFKVATLGADNILIFAETKGLDDKRQEALLPKINYELNNLSVPYQKVIGLKTSINKKGDFFRNESVSHLNRLNTKEKQDFNYFDFVLNSSSNVDLFTFELGMQDFVDFYSKGGYLQIMNFMTRDREGFFPEENIISQYVKNGSKGVLLNLPEVLDLPYFQLYSYDRIISEIGEDILEDASIEIYNKNAIRKPSSGDLFLPSVSLNGLLKKKSGNNVVIKDEDVIGVEEQWSVNYYNESISRIAKKNNIPVVDLFSLYRKIKAGEYITHDGVKVTHDYPNGNFFSNDGIYPSAFGQAVIANEVIKVINSVYGTEIPIISTSKFNK